MQQRLTGGALEMGVLESANSRVTCYHHAEIYGNETRVSVNREEFTGSRLSAAESGGGVYDRSSITPSFPT
jgi:hypothetical protein